MNTDVRPALPGTAIPDGCLPWGTEHTSRWTRELPPRWIPVPRVGLRVFKLVLSAGVLAALGLTLEGLPPYLAVLAGLNLIWLQLRPEAVRVSAPALVVVAVVLRPAPALPVLAGAFLLAATTSAVTALRLRARKRQREAALAASAGVTAPVPDAGLPLGRGRLLSGLGIILILAGAPLIATAGVWDSAEGRQAAGVAGWLVTGLGVTALLSGELGRRRAVALRAAPTPVLRVLTRGTRHGDAKVFAADDLAGLRPLFTVGMAPPDQDAECGGKRDPDHGTDPVADAVTDVVLDVADLAGARDRLDDDLPGPLREAVLYGTPYDGAEIVLVTAPAKAGDPPVARRSSGPVRPLSESGVRRRLVRAKRTAARAAADDERHFGLVEVARLMDPEPVRRWRAGAVDRLAGLLMVAWGIPLCWLPFTGGGTGLWKQFLALLIGLHGAFRVPVKLRWRITADRAGLWLNGLRGTTHIPWDDLRSVRRESIELKLRWHGDGSWTVSAPRWAWYQRRRGVTHPYDALAAEVTAMRMDPALRPTGDSEERERGRPLWPLAVPFVLLWLTAVLAGMVGLPGR
ncbi:hypothetical protein [Streptomyces sp. NPDC005281]|uniref:hypothetical protein n=1 Tax=Streptomyces sp. NPDC005281 TaxID=3155712 RepID=UPI0033BA8F1E